MGLNDLMREYEERHFPLTRRLELRAESPTTARRRALHWLQSRAHEQPGTELLLLVGRSGPVRAAVEALLEELSGALLAWWQPFGPSSLALRLAEEPRLHTPAPPPTPKPGDEGRTAETAGAVLIGPEADIPEELLPLARRVAELRRDYEGVSVDLLGVLLRRVWIEAEAISMEERIPWDEALERLLAREEERMWEGE
jgi:hypothetical protein